MCSQLCVIFGGIFFDFPFFFVFTENGNLKFSATCFGLITHIIKLFQTVQIQKARLKIC